MRATCPSLAKARKGAPTSRGKLSVQSAARGDSPSHDWALWFLTIWGMRALETGRRCREASCQHKIRGAKHSFSSSWPVRWEVVNRPKVEDCTGISEHETSHLACAFGRAWGMAGGGCLGGPSTGFVGEKPADEADEIDGQQAQRILAPALAGSLPGRIILNRSPLPPQRGAPFGSR